MVCVGEFTLARADDLTLGTFLERFSVRGARLLVEEVGGVSPNRSPMLHRQCSDTYISRL